MNKAPYIASAIAGSGIGFAQGFMTKGQELENQNETVARQIAGGTGTGITHSLAGAGIGLGVVGSIQATQAIKAMLRNK